MLAEDWAMATKYFCDVCGKETRHFELGTVEIECRSAHNGCCIRKVDLCKPCYDRFIDKLSGTKEDMILALSLKEN